MSSPTLNDIARDLGISPMTVSRALRGVGRVSAETRQNVRTAARRLGYQGLNDGVIGAPAHRGKTDQNLRLLLPVVGPNRDSVESELGQNLIRGIRDRLDLNGGALEIVDCRHLDDIMDVWHKNRFTGLVMRGHLPARWVEQLRALGPLVVATSHDFYHHVDSVYANEIRTAGMIAEELLQLGHRCIAWLGVVDLHSATSPLDSRFDPKVLSDRPAGNIHAPRYAAWGYVAASLGQGAPIFLERDCLREDLDQAVERGLRLLAPLQPTVIVAPTDYVGEALLQVCRRQGIDVPGELSIVTYGGTSIAANCRPVLAAIELPMYTIGRAIPEIIERRIAAPDAPAISFQIEATFKPAPSLAPPRTHAVSLN